MYVVQAPDPRLRFKTKPVKKINQGLLNTIKEMIKTTKSFVDPEGVGLASTQIGNNEQFFIMKTTDNTFKAVFNPKIFKFSKKTKLYLEGCLSIPNYYAEITRFLTVTVSYLDEKGNEVKERLTGIPAWIFQHEYDHLQGKLFMDLALEQKSRVFKVVGKDRTGADVFEEVTI
ncbi:peptide deformylase [Candidatus Daviesbacteria bacterium]|nr:peptide deformylase [Candidatus Daviesbacteria bacterium]